MITLQKRAAVLGLMDLIKTEPGGRDGSISIGNFILVFAQLALVLAVIYVFGVEGSSGLVRIIPLILVGFAVHAWMPLKYRPAFFLALSFAALFYTFGLIHGVMLVGIGLSLLAICHLPLSYAIRVALLVAVAAGLMTVRMEWVAVRWTALPTLVLPVIGAMFMFRLIIYMYDLPHEKRSASISERISYFFMFPNLYFLLFPVIDYQTYKRTYFDQDAFGIYRKGLHWMFRGVVQLLVYRVIYMHVLPAAGEVVDLGSVVQFMVATYLLYLRISGQFHLIVGLMCLFGYNLPETHHLYYLASSFNDYWRRINIYWKDFMMKIFYYPSYMRIRRLGNTTALVLSTVIVFAGTWLLHSYQWLWLRGAFPLTATDGLFWGILGGLVVINSLSEARRVRKRAVSSRIWSFRASLTHAARVVGMFVLLTVLWALWSSPSVQEFMSLLGVAARSPLSSWLLLGLGLLALVGIGIGIQYLLFLRENAAPAVERLAGPWSTISVGASALVLLAIASPSVHRSFGPAAVAMVHSVQTDQLNAQDRERQERGYYEGLLNEERFTSALWAQWKPRNWNRENTYTENTEDMFRKVLLPNVQVVDRGASLSTNRWGMRDRDYALEKGEGVYRIAVLGASHVMGLGVLDHEPFEAVLEEMLRDQPISDEFHTVEVLNFAVTAYGLLQNIAVVEHRIEQFDPDAVFYITHNGELDRSPEKLLSWPFSYDRIPYPYLRDLAVRADLSPEMPRTEAQRRIRPYRHELVEWGYGQVAELARARGILPVWVYLPLIGKEDVSEENEKEFLFSTAAKAGFLLIDLDGVYDAHPVTDVIVAPWDNHPGPLGHRLVAQRLYGELAARSTEFGL